MARLFISLYVDEDVDVLIAHLLRARGFEVITTREAGNVAKDDLQQIEYAVSQKKTFLTHNRFDFERIHKQYLDANKQHYGIIVAVRRTPHKLARKVLAILNHVSADEMENQLRYIKGGISTEMELGAYIADGSLLFEANTSLNSQSSDYFFLFCFFFSCPL